MLAFAVADACGALPVDKACAARGVDATQPHETGRIGNDACHSHSRAARVFLGEIVGAVCMSYLIVGAVRVGRHQPVRDPQHIYQHLAAHFEHKGLVIMNAQAGTYLTCTSSQIPIAS